MAVSSLIVMNYPADSHLPVSQSLNSESELSGSQSNVLSTLGAELAFIQDEAGQYIRFYWQQAKHYGLECDQLIGAAMGATFGPVALTPYLERIQRVIDGLIPERFAYPFRYDERYFLFDLTISPILSATDPIKTVLVMGRLLPHGVNEQGIETHSLTAYPALQPSLDIHQKLLSQIVGSIRRTLPPSSELYQKLLTQMARNIRRTLDLKTIWQQTVTGLGQALGVSRCVLCPYEPGNSTVTVVAEYSQERCPSMLGLELIVGEQPGWIEAIATKEPVAVEQIITTFENSELSMLVVATCYQDQPNSLICLHQCLESPRDGNQLSSEGPTSCVRRWSAAEIEFVRDLAEQVGTAIAHATLYQELEAARKQAEAASRLKSEFLANTSHELRTPLNGMIGFLKLIIDGLAEDPEEQNEFLQEAYRSALHLLNLINDVLDIAKIEAGKMQLDLGPVKLSELLNDVEDLTRAQVQQKHLDFQIQKPPTYDEIILYANYQRLLQVMLNLVGNAIKFTHEGGITISVEVLKKKVFVHNLEFPGMVKVRVADTGIGVSLDKQDKLFQSFSQVDSSRTRQYGGTGLGLAISQKLVEAMGGVVNFFSMGEGLGSTVTFTVPLQYDPVMICTQPNDSMDILS